MSEELLTKLQAEFHKGIQIADKIREFRQDSSSSEDSLPQLNADVKVILSNLKAHSRELEILGEQEEDDDMKEKYKMHLKVWREKQDILRSNLRGSNLQAKKNAEASIQERRKALLGGGKEAQELRQKLQTQAGLVSASESITDGLKRTRQVMAQEVERGIATLQVLDDSQKTLGKSGNQYSDQKQLLGSTKRLMGKLQRQDVLDRFILITGSLLFALVCVSVLLRRVFGVSFYAPFTSSIFSTKNGNEIVANYPVPEAQPSVIKERINFVSSESSFDELSKSSVEYDEDKMSVSEELSLENGQLQSENQEILGSTVLSQHEEL